MALAHLEAVRTWVDYTLIPPAMSIHLSQPPTHSTPRPKISNPFALWRQVFPIQTFMVSTLRSSLGYDFGFGSQGTARGDKKRTHGNRSHSHLSVWSKFASSALSVSPSFSLMSSPYHEDGRRGLFPWNGVFLNAESLESRSSTKYYRLPKQKTVLGNLN